MSYSFDKKNKFASFLMEALPVLNHIVKRRHAGTVLMDFACHGSF